MNASTSGSASSNQHSEFRELLSQLIGNRSPLGNGSLLRVLSKHGVDQREHHLALALARMRQCIAQEMHAATLPGGFQHLRHRGLDPHVGIGDHQLHAA
jgi:hypothetical protein